MYLVSLCPQTSLPCVDSLVLDVERLGVSQASDNHQPSVNLDQLSPPHAEATPRTPADISIAVASKSTHVWMKGWRGGGGRDGMKLCWCSQVGATSSTGARCPPAASCVRWSCLTSRPRWSFMRTSRETSMEVPLPTHYRHLLVGRGAFIRAGRRWNIRNSQSATHSCFQPCKETLGCFTSPPETDVCSEKGSFKWYNALKNITHLKKGLGSVCPRKDF